MKQRILDFINKIKDFVKKITNFAYKIKEYTNTTKFRVFQLCFLLILLVLLIFFIWSLKDLSVCISITNESIYKASSQNFYFYSFTLFTALLLKKNVRTLALNCLIFIVGRAILLIVAAKKIIKVRLSEEVDELHTVLGIIIKKKWSKEDLIQFIEKRLNIEYRDRGQAMDADVAELIYNAILEHHPIDLISLDMTNFYFDQFIRATKLVWMHPDLFNVMSPQENAIATAACVLIVVTTFITNCILHYYFGP